MLGHDLCVLCWNINVYACIYTVYSDESMPSCTTLAHHNIKQKCQELHNGEDCDSDEVITITVVSVPRGLQGQVEDVLCMCVSHYVVYAMEHSVTCIGYVSSKSVAVVLFSLQ